MLGTDYLIDGVATETHCIIHLASLATPAMLEWRPTPGQRSTVELLRYLAITAIGPARFFVDGSWEAWEQLSAQVADLSLEGFPQAMNQQEAAFRSLVTSLSPADLSRMVSAPWGETLTVAKGLALTSLRFLSAYKMQLFLYLRSQGVKAGSSDLWRGLPASPTP